MRLDEFLNQQHVAFRRLHHRPAYTANHVAQALHVKGKDMAKSVLVHTGHGYVLAVLPATHRVDLDRLRQELGEEQVGLASEAEMQRLFPDCERGAMPPFGSLYHLPTLVDESLTQDEEITFEGVRRVTV
jgi:Ala-tRNA(Pro) deacylase